jgi:hypothetical protein
VKLHIDREIIIIIDVVCKERVVHVFARQHAQRDCRNKENKCILNVRSDWSAQERTRKVNTFTCLRGSTRSATVVCEVVK